MARLRSEEWAGEEVRMLDPSFEELRTSGRLPSPPAIGLEVLRVTADVNFCIDDLVRVVQADPVLTGRILQLANSLTFRIADPVTTLHEATIRLGQRAIRHAALGFSVIASMQSGPCAGFEYERYWSNSVVRAVVCQNLSRRLKIGNAAESFVCGLLSHIGRLALATAHAETYGEVLERSREDQEALTELERRAYGIDHIAVSVAMLQEWGLPPAFLDAVRSIEDNSDTFATRAEELPGLGEVLWVATRIAEAFDAREHQPDDVAAVHEVLGRFQRWDPEELVRVWEESREEWTLWGAILGFDAGEVPVYEELDAVLDSDTPPFPLRPREEHARARSTDAEEHHILAVDDDRMSLKRLELTLVSEGYRVTCASSGEEALRLALEHDPDIVIADWMMPGMSGTELCAALRSYEAGRQMYVILLTSQSEEDQDQVVQAFDSGVDDYVVKPFRRKLLLARVRAGQRVVRLQREVEEKNQTMQKQVSELNVLTRKLTWASLTDPLTELPNRRHAMETLEREWGKAVHGHHALSAIAIDIDHFKKINDRYGHDVGDLVLCEVARALEASIERPGFVARMGGEEFLALLPGVPLEVALQRAESVRLHVVRRSERCPHIDGGTTISLGVASHEPSMQRLDNLLKAADEALYEAKERGRDRVCAARPLVPSALPRDGSRTTA